jgi:hypothetical protein
MPQDTSVKFFFGNPFSRIHANAPKLSMNAGGLIAVLDACLVNGIGQVTATSLTIDAYGVATLTTSAAHGYQRPETRILIQGADQTALNREWIIKDIPTSTTLRFDVSGLNLENSTATGTITCAIAPLGWTKEYSGTNLAVYRAKGGNRPYLYIDDTSSFSRVRGYRSMTSLTNGTDPFPTDAQFTGGGYWNHWSNGSYYGNSSSGTDLSWHLVGDDRFFYLGCTFFCHNGCADGYRQQLYRSCYFFGEFPSYKTNDINNLVIQHARGQTYGSGYYGEYHDGAVQDEFYFSANYQGKHLIGRADNTVNSQTRFSLSAPLGYLTNSSSTNDSIASRYSTLSKRNIITGGGIHFAYPTAIISETEGIRGYMPGLYFSAQSNYWGDSVFYEDTIFTDSAGRKFFVAPHANGAYQGTFYFIRIDTNWRSI